jgi:hypothetical protein
VTSGEVPGRSTFADFGGEADNTDESNKATAATQLNLDLSEIPLLFKETFAQESFE